MCPATDSVFHNEGFVVLTQRGGAGDLIIIWSYSPGCLENLLGMKYYPVVVGSIHKP